MGYFVRVFCTSNQAPRLSAAQRWLKDHGSSAALEDADLDDAGWEEALLTYKRGKRPIIVTCARDTGSESLLREEIGEFEEFLEELDLSEAKKQVESHLEATKFIVACQLPTSDIDDDGFTANDVLLAFFVETCGGMIQADGEGFYYGEDQLLEVGG